MVKEEKKRVIEMEKKRGITEFVEIPFKRVVNDSRIMEGGWESEDVRVYVNRVLEDVKLRIVFCRPSFEILKIEDEGIFPVFFVKFPVMIEVAEGTGEIVGRGTGYFTNEVVVGMEDLGLGTARAGGGVLKEGGEFLPKQFFKAKIFRRVKIDLGDLGEDDTNVLEEVLKEKWNVDLRIRNVFLSPEEGYRIFSKQFELSKKCYEVLVQSLRKVLSEAKGFYVETEFGEERRGFDIIIIPLLKEVNGKEIEKLGFFKMESLDRFVSRVREEYLERVGGIKEFDWGFVDTIIVYDRVFSSRIANVVKECYYRYPDLFWSVLGPEKRIDIGVGTEREENKNVFCYLAGKEDILFLIKRYMERELEKMKREEERIRKIFEASERAVQQIGSLVKEDVHVQQESVQKKAGRKADMIFPGVSLRM